MADYSIDDILAELDAKKSGSSGESGKSYGSQDDIPVRHHDISATAILEGLDGTDDGIYLREKDGSTEEVDAEYISDIEDNAENADSVNNVSKKKKTDDSSAASVIDEIADDKNDVDKNVDKVLSETDNFMISDESSEIDIDERTANAKAKAES